MSTCSQISSSPLPRHLLHHPSTWQPLNNQLESPLHLHHHPDSSGINRDEDEEINAESISPSVPLMHDATSQSDNGTPSDNAPPADSPQISV
ncbi:hypothetical protein LXL04_007925 [Taraxacum kok-saghyz]